MYDGRNQPTTLDHKYCIAFTAYTVNLG